MAASLRPLMAVMKADFAGRLNMNATRQRRPRSADNRSDMRRRRWHIVALLVVAMTAILVGAREWRRRHIAAIVRRAVPSVPNLRGWPLLPAARVHAATAAALHLSDPMAALRELAGLYHANGHYEQARQVELGLAAREPTEARWQYYLADTYRNLGDMAAYRARLERAIALAPHDRTFHLRLAELLFKEGDASGAEREYRARLRLVPGDPYARLGLARTALGQGDTEGARRWLEAIVVDTPEFAPSHNLLAQLYAEQGDVARAEKERRLGALAGRFREADDPWLFRLNGWSFDPGRQAIPGVPELQRQELERAAQLCHAVIESAPTSLEPYQALGMIHLALGWTPDPAKPVVDLGGDLKERMARGRRVYETVCFACHMPHGEGQPGIFPPLASSDFVQADKGRAITVPVRGLTGTIVVNGRAYTNTMLPQSQLTTAQIADVLTYVMNSWGNDLGAVTGTDVENVRRGAGR